MNLPRLRCQLSVTSEYRRFQVRDFEASELSGEWTEQVLADRAKVSAGFIVVYPERDGRLPVEVSLWSEAPTVMFNHWQHVFEAPLVSTGRIVIEDWDAQEQATFAVDPGEYTVRVLFRGLETVSEDRFSGQDFYAIQIWKSACPQLRVLRRWP